MLPTMFPFFIMLFLNFIYFPSVDTVKWVKKSSLPGLARHHPITFSNGTHGFVVTGTTYDAKYGNKATKEFYVYTESTDSWTQLEDFPGTSRSYGYGVTVADKAYIGFGRDANYTTYLSDWWQYDMTNSIWLQLRSCDCVGRNHPAMVGLSNNKIYVGLGDGIPVGGSKKSNFDDWWEYSISDNTWTEKSKFPSTARHHPYYFGIGNYAYVGFGHSKETYDVIERDWYKYDPTKDNWKGLNPLNFASFHISATGNKELVTTEGRVAGTQFSHKGFGYVLSGDGDDHSSMNVGEFHEFNPVTQEWRVLPSHPNISRWAPGSFVLDSNRVYLTCGQTAKYWWNDLWMIDLEGTENQTFTVDLVNYPNQNSGSNVHPYFIIFGILFSFVF